MEPQCTRVDKPLFHWCMTPSVLVFGSIYIPELARVQELTSIPELEREFQPLMNFVRRDMRRP